MPRHIQSAPIRDLSRVRPFVTFRIGPDATSLGERSTVGRRAEKDGSGKSVLIQTK